MNETTPAQKMPDTLTHHKNKAIKLLEIEEEMRKCKTTQQLAFLIANEMRTLIKASHIFVFKRNMRGKFNLICASDIAIIDRNTPAIAELEAMLAKRFKKIPPKELGTLSLPHAENDAPLFPKLSWYPFRLYENDPFAGMLVVEEENGVSSQTALIERLAETAAHCWAALIGHKRARAKRHSFFKNLRIPAALAIILMMGIPVPLTILAPMQIIPENPYIITAQIDGVIAEIAVKPNQNVKKGTLLYKMTDTELQSLVAIAKREINIGETALENARRAAFSSEKSRHEIALEQARLEMKKTQYHYAKSQLAKTLFYAPKDGIAVFADVGEWVGKPVAAGERIMRIAEGEKILFQIDVPASDVGVIKIGARALIFPDSDALSPIEATIIRAAHNARITEQGILAFKVIAKIRQSDKIPRLGTRGTAQILGDKIPLFLFLFRRPITAFRQWSGL